MMYLTRKIISLILLLMFLLNSALPAYAFDYYEVDDSGTYTKTECPTQAGSSYTRKVVNCAQKSIESATETFLSKFTDVMKPVTMAFSTLVIALLGIRLMNGEHEIEKKATALLIKLAAMWFFAFGLGGYAPAIFKIMTSMQTFILDIEMGTDTFQCQMPDGSALLDSWQKMDCIIGKLFGFGGGFTMVNSMLGIMSAVLFSGSMGVMLFFMGITALISVLMFAFRAVYIVIAAYLYVGFLITLSPLFVPLMMLGITSNVYSKWLSNLIGSMAKPVLLFVFLMISLPILDNVLFSKENSYSLQSVVDKYNITEFSSALQQSAQLFSLQTPTKTGGDGQKTVYGDDKYTKAGEKQITDILNPALNGKMDIGSLFKPQTVDFSQLKDKDGKPVKTSEVMKDLTRSMLTVWVTVWLLANLLDAVITVSTGIFGGGSALRQVAGKMPFEKSIGGVIGGLQQKAGGSKGIQEMFRDSANIKRS